MRLTARGPIANPCRCAGACGLTVLLAVIALGCSQATDPGSDAVLSTPSSPPAGAGSDPALDDFIQAKMDEAHYPGAVCGIVKDGRIVFAGAYGWADIEKRVPMATDAIIGLASVSKTVLATAAMECVERGTLSLDDDIDRTLGYTVRNPKHPDVPVTPRMLMTHTSSIKDRWEILDSLVNWGSDSSIPLDDFVRGYTTPGGAYWTAKNWGEYRPGDRYAYTNAGAATCGAVLEHAAATPFAAWCNEHVFAPLGMTDTSWRLRDLPAGRLAAPYEWEGRYVPKEQYGYADYPDGMVHTTVGDLSRFLIAYLQGGVHEGGRILEAETIDAMLTPQVPDLDKTQGLFWLARELDGRALWGHNGGDYGISSEMWMDRATGEGVILLANGSLGSKVTEAASNAILARLFEKAATL